MSFKSLTSRSLPLGLSIVLILTATLAQAAAPAGSEAAPSIDKATTKSLSPETVLVKVNGTPVTQGDLDNWITQTIKSEYGKRGVSVEQLPPEQVAQMRQALQSVARDQVIMKILVQAAAKPYLNKVDKEVEAQLAEIRKNAASQGVTDLEKYLTEKGSSLDEVKDSIRQQMAGIKYIEATEGPVEPSEKEIREYIEQNKSELDQVRTSHILIEVGNPRDPSVTPTEEEWKKAKEKAEQVLKEARGGADFGKLAAKYSDDPGSKDNGGSYPAIRRHGQFVEEYSAAAFKLQKPGELTEPVKSAFGYHIIKLDERIPASFESVGDEVKKQLRGKNLEKKGGEAIMKLQKAAKIETLVPDTNPESAFGPSRGQQNDSATTATAPKSKSGASKNNATKSKPRARATK